LSVQTNSKQHFLHSFRIFEYLCLDPKHDNTGMHGQKQPGVVLLLPQHWRTQSLQLPFEKTSRLLEIQAKGVFSGFRLGKIVTEATLLIVADWYEHHRQH